MSKYTDDIPIDLARASHAGTSMVPEHRAIQEREGYSAQLESDHAVLSKLANTDEKRATLESEWDRYRSGYRRRTIALLGAKSRCISTMITGPSNFPTRRAQKANDSEHRRSTELIEWRGRAMRSICKKLQPELAPIMSGDSDALVRLREKIAKAEEQQKAMKQVNRAIRANKKKGPEAQVAALVKLGFPEKAAARALEPDAIGRVGYPDYSLSNNNANIRRMKARLAQIERAHATPDTEVEGDNARVEDCPAENRVRLFFPGKPEADVRKRLKDNGFRWARSIEAWQAYRNHNSIAVANDVAGVEAAAS